MRSCSACGAVLSATARFCSDCGVALRPEGSDRDEAELRQLTALFCDLVGSTELSSAMGAEEFGDLIRDYLRDVTAVVERYEGDVARFIGDGMLAHFGWPTAHDDDAERAVRASLDIVADLEAREEESTFPLSVRIGVHTGPVLIGEVRRARQAEVMALGEAMNVAARLQAVAPPNGVAISAATERLVRGIFLTEDLGDRELKGIPEPVHTFRVLQPTGVRSRLDAAQGRLTPFVGRDCDFGVLRERWRAAGEGRGHTVLVVGEAGVGKSRLVYELRRLALTEQHSWLECRCSSYTRQSAFRPAIELIETGLQVDPRSPVEEQIIRLERGLASAGVAGEEAIALLAPLLGLPARADGATARMSLERRKRRTIELLSRWVTGLASAQPMVLLVEDLQWADPSSLDLMTRLIEVAPAEMILVVATARPEFEVPWKEGPELTILSLEPLERDESRQLVAALSGDRRLPGSILEQIVSSTDGIPLYIEEVARAVLDSVSSSGAGNSPTTEIQIPTTLHATLLARLDRSADAKRVAQRAAVIGRDFQPGLLEEVAEVDPGTLSRGLASLVDNDLVFSEGEKRPTYTFKHALIQDAAYQSLPRKTRTALHGRIAEALERRTADGVGGAPEVIARHFEAAGLIESAVKHYRLAAEQAALRSGHHEAVNHLRKAIELLRKLPADRRWEVIELQLQTSLASSVMSISSYGDPAVGAAYERARELCELLEDDHQMGYALAGLSIVHSNQANLKMGEELAEQVLAISARKNDETLELLARIQLAVPTCYGGRYEAALAHCRRALELYDAERHEWITLHFGTDHGVAAHGFASLSLCLLGYADGALEEARLGLAHATRLGQPFNIAFSLTSAAVLQWLLGDLRAQEETGARIAAIGEEQEFEIWMGLGRIFEAGARAISTGDAEAIPRLMEGTTMAARSGLRGAVPALLALLAESYLAVGDLDSARGTVEGALTIAYETGQLAWEPRLLSLNGSLLLEPPNAASGDAAREAESRFRRAIDVAKAQNGRLEELRASAMLARLLASRGEIAQAAAVLGPPCDWFRRESPIADLRAARMLLADLGAGRGAPAERAVT